MSKTPFYRIYTGDYTAVGYQDGVADGKQGKPKSHFGIFKRHWFNYFWQSQESSNSYSAGYNSGHQDGLRIRENIYHQTGAGNMQPENFKEIRAKLTEAMDDVKKNINQLATGLEYYERQINAMKSAGFMNDYADQLRKYNGLEIRIKKLQEFLEEFLRALQKIDQDIEDLQ